MVIRMEKQNEKQKNKKKVDVISILLILIGVGMIGFALAKLIPIFLQYYQEEEAYEEIREDYVELKSVQELTEADKTWWYDSVFVNLEELQKENEDVTAWIRFDNMELSYPVVYSGDNETYLHADLNKEYSKAGTLFIDKKNNPDFSDGNTIIYGHNMKNNSMFGKLKKYKKDGFYDKNQYFTIYTEGQALRYHIFSYYDTEETDPYYFTEYEGEEALGKLFSDFQSKSYLDTGVEVDAKDKTVTLSTCSAEGMRFLVTAVLEETYDYESETLKTVE